MSEGGNDERLFKHEHIRAEDLLTDGPNNFVQQIQTEETTVARTKKQVAELVAARRYIRIANHEAVYDLFLPYIAFGGFLLLLVQSFIAMIAIVFS